MSSEEYVVEIIRSIYEVEDSLSPENRLPEGLLKLWIEHIKTFCKKAHQDYLLGKRDHYFINESEYDEIFDKAGMDYTSELLNNLIDRDFVEVGIDDQGEIVYKATELGRKVAKNK